MHGRSTLLCINNWIIRTRWRVYVGLSMDSIMEVDERGPWMQVAWGFHTSIRWTRVHPIIPPLSQMIGTWRLGDLVLISSSDGLLLMLNHVLQLVCVFLKRKKQE